MKLKTAELKRFKANSSFIKHNNILPILGYLKFDGGVVTKTSLHSFIEQDMDFEGSLLVDENVLFNFLNYTNEPVITVTEKSGRVTITDGKSTVSCPSEDIKTFPSTPESETEGIELSNEVLCAIKFAANFTDNMEMPDVRGHVFLGSKLVSGCNGIIGYTETFKEELPKVSLLKEVASIVGKFPSATFSEGGNYVFFSMDSTKYGFIKSQYPFTDLTRISKIDKKANSFTVNKDDILFFNEMCVSSTKAKGLAASMSIEDGKLTLSMSDSDFNVDVTKTIEVSGEMDDSFTFNPQMMSTQLKNLPDNELTFYQSKGSYFITGETGFVSIIQQLQLLTN